MSSYPKWVTTERQAYLVSLFCRSKGFCIFGHYKCPYPEHHYENFINTLVKEWILDDRTQSNAEWRQEQKELHTRSYRYLPLRGQFSAVSKDIFYDNQPQFYIVAFGISGLTFKPFAKVRLASSYIVLWIELDKLTYARLSKGKRRKAVRYHKRVDEIDSQVILAVKDCLSR